MMSLFFIYGAYLSGSRLGGIVTTLCFFFNHGESTRVMWTPPLRESFAYPFLVLQMLLLTYILRTRNPSRTALVALGISTLCFMLPWQFAQFVLLTQVNRERQETLLLLNFLLTLLFFCLPIHPSSSAYPGSGRGGSSFSREAQTSLSPATWASS
uniref:Putative C-mannosyltransferase DPY19L2P2 n=1 Tax=Fundulus heteroclitus TaxID=8078 RepID=A0A3Q2SZ64_FUNHE